MDVKQVLTENKIWLRRASGQHFLIDEEILDYEIRLANLNKEDIVLEIGAGVGNVTEKIAKKAHVIAIERDRRFVPLLEKIKNADIVNKDALDVIKNIQFNKVIANIPYAISQKILLELLKKKWDVAVIIVQKEFAQKLKKDKLALLLHDCVDVKIIGGISAEAFYPRGAASSIVVLKQKALMDEKFWIFLNKAYRNRNKNISNVFPECDDKIAKKKIHQLMLEELRSLYQTVTAA